MAKASVKDGLDYLDESVSVMTLQERQKQTLIEIEKLRLENELAELETRDRLLKERERRKCGKVGESQEKKSERKCGGRIGRHVGGS